MVSLYPLLFASKLFKHKVSHSQSHHDKWPRGAVHERTKYVLRTDTDCLQTHTHTIQSGSSSSSSMAVAVKPGTQQPPDIRAVFYCDGLIYEAKYARRFARDSPSRFTNNITTPYTQHHTTVGSDAQMRSRMQKSTHNTTHRHNNGICSIFCWRVIHALRSTCHYHTPMLNLLHMPSVVTERHGGHTYRSFGAATRALSALAHPPSHPQPPRARTKRMRGVHVHVRLQTTAKECA